MNRTRRMVGIAWLLAGLFLQAGGLGAAELPRPSDANRLWFSMTYSLAGDPAEIAAIKTRYGRAIYAPLCFSHFLQVSLPWGQESLPTATSMASFQADVDTLVQRAQQEGVGLHLTLCYGIARNVWDYAAAKQEDLRNAQWYSDQRLATPQQLPPGAGVNGHVWTTPSRYARKLRVNLRQKTLAAFATLRQLGETLPAALPLIVSGPGEAELNSGRLDPDAPLSSLVCDYSPFAVLEFRDWITHEGLYAPGQPFDGQGWANGGARYQGAAGLAQFNADFATAFTSWELRYYRWSLEDELDAGALPWTGYDPTTGLFPTDPAQFLEGGFDPPRTLKVAGADPFWDLWMTFRQALIAHYVADVAGWARETGFPMDRYFTHQIPADYLFGSKAGDSPQNARHYTSASPLSTAYPPDGTSAGVTIYDINFGTWVARTSEHVLAPLRAGGRPWAALEYNPEVVPASGVSLLSFASPLLEGFSAAVSAKAPALATPRAAIAPVADIYQQLVRLHDAAPTLISFYDWISTSEWQFKDTNRGLALDQYFAQVRDTGRAPLATRFTPPALSQVAGEYQPGGALRLAWSPEIWPGQGHLWPDWGQFLTFRVFSGNTPDFALSAATASWDTLDPTWLVEAPGKTFYRVAAVNRDGTVGPLSPGIGPEIPVIRLDRTTLCFAAAGSAITAGQAIRIGNAGSGTLHWTATPSSSWIVLDRSSGTGNSQVGVSVAPAGLPVGTHVGTVTIADPAAANAPQEVVVRLVVLARGGNPYGVVDTPTNNQTGITGNTPVTGWALDDIEVTAVRIYRDPMPGEPVQPNGKVYIGDASFVAGARPDVEAAYATTPFASRAGWGYMMLTNFLPGGGNGTFRIHAYASDRDGHTVLLGTRQITCDNAHATLPFGTIDTPEQGGATSGSSYLNFGWALTPQPAAIPTDGSTLLVWVDGLPLGHPTYNQYRPDIATLFPGYANSDGAVGFFYLNPSTLSEGTHSLSWSVEDSLGRLNGIGSRYFSVEHPSGGVHTGTARRAPTMDVPTIDPPMQMLVHRGFAGTRETVHPDGEGGFFLKTEINQPLRIELGRSPQGIWSGLERVLGQPRPLPVGSRFDAQTGTFSWLPGPGFAGDFCLEFAASAGRVLCVRVRVKPGASGGGR